MDTTTKTRRQRSPAVVLAMAVALVLVLALVAVMVSANRTSPQLDLTSPEGVVQAWVQRIADRDPAAFDLLVEPDRCDAAMFDEGWLPESMRVAVLDVAVTDGEATVDVRVTESPGGGPFNLDEWTHDETYRLERAGEEWRISHGAWPVYCN